MFDLLYHSLQPSSSKGTSSRVIQIKHEESMDIVSRENEGERLVSSISIFLLSLSFLIPWLPKEYKMRNHLCDGDGVYVCVCMVPLYCNTFGRCEQRISGPERGFV